MKASPRQAAETELDIGDPYLEAQRIPVPKATGESALLFALVDDCARILANKKKDGSTRELKRRAMRWIAGEPPAPGCFSFQSVCEHLGIEPTILRSRLYNAAGRSRKRTQL